MGTEKVYIVYRRGEAEMPARLEEQHHAKEEGIEFLTLTNPTEILGGEDGRVCGMYFDRQLRKSGLFDRLEEQGIQDGDTVSIYDYEFEYTK